MLTFHIPSSRLQIYGTCEDVCSSDVQLREKRSFNELSLSLFSLFRFNFNNRGPI